MRLNKSESRCFLVGNISCNVFLAAPERNLHAVGHAAEDDPRHAPAPGLPNPLAPDPDPGIPPKKPALTFKLFFPHPLEVVEQMCDFLS